MNRNLVSIPAGDASTTVVRRHIPYRIFCKETKENSSFLVTSHHAADAVLESMSEFRHMPLKSSASKTLIEMVLMRS